MTDKDNLSHFVALYWVPEGCMIVEIDGPSVWQFGPFNETVQPRAMATSMFAELQTVTLDKQAAKLDDQAVLILGNRAFQRPAPDAR